MAAQPQEPDLRFYIPEIQRRLPQAPEAEKGVLCSFFLAPQQIGQLCAEKDITRAHFHIPAHAIVFGVLKEFWDENEPIDSVIIRDFMHSKGLLPAVGGVPFITELTTYLPTAANASHYLDTIQEMFILREVIGICTEGAARGYDHQDDVPKLLNDTVERMMKIVRIAEGQKLRFCAMDELVRMSMDRFEADLTREKPEMPTGIHRLDYYTGGFIAPEIWVIMARSTQGKSALAVNIAEHLAIEHSKRVGYISLEMGAVQLTTRMIFSRAGCNREEIKRRRYMTDEEREFINQAGIDVAAAKDRIFIREDGALTPSEISATATAWKAKYGLDVLFIDHAQLAKSDTRSNGRTEEVEAISRSMNPLAKRLNIAIVILSQVTVGKEPENANNYTAKNSKALEEDADKLLIISHTATGSWINISKNREGEKGVSVPVLWSPETQRFSDREPEAPEQLEIIHVPKQSKKGRK